MSIPEAVGLILQSAVLSRGGEVFALEMGDPLKIRELARQMIELSGFIPGRDMVLEFTGLRPGEKLSEESTRSGEMKTQTPHPKIHVIKESGDTPAIIADLERISSGFHAYSDAELRVWIHQHTGLDSAQGEP